MVNQVIFQKIPFWRVLHISDYKGLFRTNALIDHYLNVQISCVENIRVQEHIKFLIK